MDNSFIYIADADNDAIRQLDLASGRVTTLIGWNYLSSQWVNPESEQLCLPHGVATNADGTLLLIADTCNQLIRLYDTSSGTLTTISGALPAHSSGAETIH